MRKHRKFVARGSPESIRVVHFAEVIKGGICTYLREVTALQSRSFGAGAVIAVVPASQRAELAVPAGVRVVEFPDASNRIVNTLRMAWLSWRVLAEHQPDIVHLHSTFAGALLRPLLAALRCRAKVFYCPHGWSFYRDSGFLVRQCEQWLERVWSNWCDVIVCVSEHERRAGLRIGISHRKLAVVRNGLPASSPVAEERRIDWPEGRRRLFFVGRFDRQKGIDVLAGALDQLGDEAYAYVAGGSLRNSLDALPPNASSVGWLNASGLEAYYRAADVLVMPSRWEGFPFTAVEAMRSGLPVVASKVGGVPEVVEDGVTGLLVPAGDQDALVAAIRGLDGERLAAMRRASRERFMSKLTIDDTHRILSGLYRHVLSQQDARSAVTSFGAVLQPYQNWSTRIH